MKIMYWTVTLVLAFFLLWSSYTYFFGKSTIEGLRELGFPDFFRIQLGVLKLIAVAILLVPGIPLMVKEWAYAGVALFLLTAIVAHIAHKDAIGILLLLALLSGVLIMSRYYLYKVSAI